MDENLKEVPFNKYCEKCKHKDLRGWEEPCNTCLETPVREGTEVPTDYKEAE